MRKKQVVNLALTKLKFPAMAIVSILHRISGVFLFLLLPVVLCCLQSSLHSAASFRHLHAEWSSIGAKMALWIFLSALAYHLLAGLRHLWMDMGYGETLRQGRYSAFCVFFVTFLVVVGLAIALW